MVENVTQDKNGIMTVSLTVKNQQHIVHAKRLMPAIIALVLASMTKIVRLTND